MSSHHIVREKQEPALLVLNLAHFDDELLGQLLEWSPTLIATTNAAEAIASQGIKVDMLVANEVDPLLQSDIKLIPTNGQLPVDATLHFLTGNGYAAANIITDEFNPDTYQPYIALINLVIFNRDKKIFSVSSGFTKWKPAGETIEILSNIGDIQTAGLEHISQNTYRTQQDGFFTLTFQQSYIFIAEDL